MQSVTSDILKMQNKRIKQVRVLHMANKEVLGKTSSSFIIVLVPVCTDGILLESLPCVDCPVFIHASEWEMEGLQICFFSASTLLLHHVSLCK